MPGFELFGAEERESVGHVLDSGVLMRYGFDGQRNGHWKAEELERALAERLGIGHAHVCSSGTTALATALAACGVGAGHEVVIPPFTFVATVEAVLHAGAVPVFAEIDATLGLDPASVEAAITPRTRAVVAVHMCGAMARIDELAALCERHGVALVEDAAQALGATFHGRPLGTFGRAGCFSFDYVKTVTCGEGGAVVTDDEGIARVVQAYTDHGHDHLGADRGADGHPHLGHNFRLSELNAAVGLAQLGKLDRMLEIQRAHKRTLVEGLSNLPRVRFRELPDDEGDSATFLSVFLPSAEEAREATQALAAQGVDGCFYWHDNNWHYHRQWDHLKGMVGPAPLPQAASNGDGGWAARELPRSDAIMSRTVSMLIKLGWSDEQLADRVERMRAVLA